LQKKILRMKKNYRDYYKTYFLRIIIVFFLTFSFYPFLRSQESNAFATVDTNKLLIGDQTYFRITVQNKRGIAVEWPVISDSLIKGIEIVKRFLPDTLSKNNDALKIELKFLITSFDSGQHNLPSFKIVLKSGATQDSISTNPVSLWVTTLVVDTAKGIFDIKKPYGAPVTFKEILPYIGIGLGLLILVLLIIYITRRLKKQKPLIPTRIITEPAHIIALRNLDLLKEEKLWQQGFVKAYYTKLTDIIRIYIEQRFEVPAMEQTSDEIMGSLNKIAIEDDACFVALREILTLADLVKFAKALPLPNENESNILNAYLFVNHTKAFEKQADTKSMQSLANTEGKEVSNG
jgi:hypothetical protein